MKYPIFAFVIGGLFVQFVNTLHAGGARDLAIFCGIAIVVLTVVGSIFEAVWNFK